MLSSPRSERHKQMMSSRKTERLFENEYPIRQLGIGKILLLFAWPIVWYTILIYAIGKQFVTATGIIPTWVVLSIMVLGPGAELIVGLILLRREGLQFTIQDLRNRIRLKWPSGWKIWIITIIVFFVGMGISMLMGPVNRALASIPGFIPPSWWPAGSNPTVTVSSASDVFPDIILKGNYAFALLYFLIGVIFNIIGEELYYRGYLLPRMRSVFGRFDWVANGVLFTLKHAYQRWLYPGIFIGALVFSFAAGPLGSLPVAMIYHWLGNFMFQMVFLVKAVLGK